jgi:hypothetical protein
MTTGQQWKSLDQQMQADGIDEVSTGVETQEEQVRDFVATLLKQIKEHQGGFCSNARDQQVTNAPEILQGARES